MTKKHDCGFNHLSKEQWSLLVADGAAVFAQLIQDEMHAKLPPEIANELGKFAMDAGMRMIHLFMENSVKINRLSAAIAIGGFAQDAGE